jgi:pSer/pThr/pTyr-binding forkhead associated (FHA) protein
MDPFLEACGATGPLQLTIEYQGRAEPIHQTLNQPFALLGRDPRMDLPFDHDQISRRHAYLQMLVGRVFCIDMQSRTGILFEKGPRRAGWLDRGQAISLGPFWIRLVAAGHHEGLNGTPLNQTTTHFLEQNPLPEVTLEILSRAAKSWTWPMTPMLALVGRSPDCRVHLVSQSVSNFHCSLVRTPMGVWVVDLLGRGGIRVNEVPVRFSRLEEKDTVQVGKFQLRLRYESEPSAHIRREVPVESHMAESAPPLSDLSILSTRESGIEADGTGQELVPAAAPGGFSLPAGDASFELAPASSAELLVVPTEAGAGTNGESSHTMLVPLLKQFGQMQQQMFDQFQQAMMMMFQMFSSLHKEQIGLVRDELRRLQELTLEVNDLQLEIARRQSASVDKKPAPEATPTFPAKRSSRTPVPRPKTPPASPSAEKPPAARANPRTQDPHRPMGSKEPAAAGPSAQAGIPGQSDAEVHAWLTERLLAIQEERQSSWKKIVQFLSGK